MHFLECPFGHGRHPNLKWHVIKTVSENKPVKRSAIQPHDNPAVLQTSVFRLKRANIFVFALGHGPGRTKSSGVDRQDSVPRTIGSMYQKSI